MNLSEQAITELREILRNDIGQEVENLNETELQEFGLFLLTIGANSLKVRARLQQ
jgi:hypothetical protein